MSGSIIVERNFIMSIPAALNSKIYHGLSAMKRTNPEFIKLGTNLPITKDEFIYQLAEVSTDNTMNRIKNVVTKRGKFTSKGKEYIKQLLERFNLGSTATWDDLFQKALERKKLLHLKLQKVE